MTEGGSVIRMREEGLLADLDIFEEGSVRDIMRFAGAGMRLAMCLRLETREEEDLQRIV